jgi:hypothetical protein
MLKKFWNDEAGAIISAELVLVLTIAVIAMVVGLTSVRDSVVTELADVAQAIANVDQSYTYYGVAGHSSAAAGSGFADALDFCDSGASFNGSNSKCVTVGGSATAAPTLTNSGF